MKYPDFEEFIASLNANGVRYLVVGAHAVAFHARPRATKDLDVHVDPTERNARRVLSAISDFFGGAKLGYTTADVTNPDLVLQMGVPPVRIDIIKSLTGASAFGTLWRRRADAAFGSVPSHYLSLDDLIANKEAAGRPQDLADLVPLKRARARKRPPRRRTRPGRGTRRSS